MRVDLVLPNIEVSGTTKYIGSLADGFASLGHSVRLIYSGQGPRADLVDLTFRHLTRVRFTGSLSQRFTEYAVGGPILRLFTDFKPSQSVNLIGSFLGSNKFDRLTADTDLIVYANTFAYPPPRLLRQRTRQEVLIFHEGIGSTNLPYPLRKSFTSFCKAVSDSVDLRMAITDQVAEVLGSEGITSRAIYHGFFSNIVPGVKEPLILADSRWFPHRSPVRVAHIAERVPGARFAVLGSFQNPNLEDQLRRELVKTRTSDRVEIRTGVPEPELLNLYGRAKCVIRWGQLERGFPFSLVYAVSSGCIPVFSSELGGARYIASEVSPDLVVKTDSELAEVLNRLLSDDVYYTSMKRKVLGWRDKRPWRAVASEIIRAAGGS